MKTYRADIDGLRSVAVLPVVLYHAGVPGITGGFLGVDVFFVISGFLITSIVMAEIIEGRFSLLSFYERRARRILPALTVVVMATFLVGWFILLPGEYKNLGQSGLATALFLSNVYFTLKLDYFTPAAEFAPLLHTWSLAVEEQFYLFFPPLLALLFAWRGFKITLWAVVALSVISLVAAIVMLPSKPDWVFYLIFFRIWELGVGALLAMVVLPVPRNKMLRDAIGVLGLLAILVPAFAYTSQTAFPGLAAVPPVLGAAAIIYVGTDGASSIISKLLSHRILVGIGLISYSLYLWHWPVIVYLRIGGTQTSLPLSLGLGLIAVVVSIGLAWLSYKFVESPFRSRPPKGYSRNAIFATSAVMLAAMVLIGGMMHLAKGVPGRLSPLAASIAAVADDINPDRKACFSRLPEDGLCGLGTSVTGDGPVDFLFWGDSHAEAMREGLSVAAKAQGKSGLFVGSYACLPIPQLQTVPENDTCTEINTAVTHFLANRTDMSVVVLDARWAIYVEGQQYRQEGDDLIHLNWVGDADAQPNDTNPSLVEAGLKASVEQILALGREVVILGQVPEVGWYVPNVLARAEMLGWLHEPPKLTLADFQARAGETHAMLSRIAASHERVRYLSLSELFCDQTECGVTDDTGLPLYTDDDHISRTTARKILPETLSEIWGDESG